MSSERDSNAADPRSLDVTEPAANEELLVHVAVTETSLRTEGTLFEIASRSTALGRRVGTVLSASRTHDALAERLQKARVAVHRFGGGYDPSCDQMRSFGEARELFRRLAPRVLHFHGRWVPCVWDSVLAARAAGVRTILRTEQDPVPSLMVQRNRMKLRVVNTSVNHVVFVSRGAVQVHVTSGCEWFKNWSIIPHGVPVDAIDRDARHRARAALGLPTHGLFAVMVGHADARNGPLDFVRAAGAAARKGSVLQFVVVGDGPFRFEAEQLASAVGLGGRIHFLGDGTDVRCLAAACDIRVHEGPSAALLEADAAGFPTVTLNSRGQSGVIANRNASVVCASGDVHGMARGLLALEAEESNQRRFVDSVEPGLLSNASYDAVYDEYQRLYAKIGVSGRSGEIPLPVPSSPMRVLA